MLLLANPKFLPYLIDGLLLDPAHPRAGLPDAMITWLQTMHTDCLAQLAVFPEGRDALLADPAVVEALQQVKGAGMDEECRELAASALLALHDDDSELGACREGPKLRCPSHIMLSCACQALALLFLQASYVRWTDDNHILYMCCYYRSMVDAEYHYEN